MDNKISQAVLHHAGLVVPDLDAAIAFYEAALGMAQVFRGEWSAPNPVFDSILGMKGTAARSCLMSAASGYLELFEFSAPDEGAPDAALPPSALGLRHICFQVDSPEIAAGLVRAAGGSDQGQLVELPGGASAVYCRDPFGNIIEFLRPGGRMPAARA